MKCPHCTVAIHSSFQDCRIVDESGTFRPIGGIFWTYSFMECPNCRQAIIAMAGTGQQGNPVLPAFLAFPKSATRPKAPPAVPAAIGEDFNEACLVLADSPKASAALSRRCLQAMLTDQGFTQRDLAPAIQAALDSGRLPSAVAGNLDYVRNVGNFAAHPTKDTNSGAIMPVLPEEAEWNLDVVEELFDVFYVQPEIARQKRAALDKRLAEAGKPPMKQ
jgi:hypothetical protein